MRTDFTRPTFSEKKTFVRNMKAREQAYFEKKSDHARRLEIMQGFHASQAPARQNMVQALLGAAKECPGLIVMNLIPIAAALIGIAFNQ